MANLVSALNIGQKIGYVKYNIADWNVLTEAAAEIERLRAELQAAVAAEREACATAAENRYWSSALEPHEVGKAIASAIRSRGGGAVIRCKETSCR